MHISSLERSNEAYRNRCAQLEEQVSAMGKGGDSPVEHLREKEDAASQMVAIAMKEANTIVATAKQNADVIVSEALRGEKLGQQLMAQTLASCEQHWPEKALYLGAQAHLQSFYARFGFVPVTDVYDEDGIPHMGMAREVSQV